MEPVLRKVTADLHAQQLVKYNEAIAAYEDVTLLIGDSVIERLQWYAHKTYAPNVVILAKGGDKTGHLLWRLQNTPSSSRVKRVILHIGTNNLKDSAKPVVDAIAQVTREIAKRFPEATIHLIPLYYRADIDPELICRVNVDIMRLPGVTAMPKFWDDILTPGQYNASEFADHVHMNLAGYERFHTKLCSVFGIQSEPAKE